MGRKGSGVKIRWQQAVWDKWLWEQQGAPWSSQPDVNGFLQRKCGLWPRKAKCMLCMLYCMITKELTKGNEGYSRMLFYLHDVWSVAWIDCNMSLCGDGVCVCLSISVHVCAFTMTHGCPYVFVSFLVYLGSASQTTAFTRWATQLIHGF